MRAKAGVLDLARLMVQFQLHIDEANGNNRYAPCRTNTRTRDGDATLEPCRWGRESDRRRDHGERVV
jgi:hypothetical protein